MCWGFVHVAYKINYHALDAVCQFAIFERWPPLSALTYQSTHRQLAGVNKRLVANGKRTCRDNYTHTVHTPGAHYHIGSCCFLIFIYCDLYFKCQKTYDAGLLKYLPTSSHLIRLRKHA